MKITCDNGKLILTSQSIVSCKNRNLTSWTLLPCSQVIQKKNIEKVIISMETRLYTSPTWQYIEIEICSIKMFKNPNVHSSLQNSLPRCHRIYKSTKLYILAGFYLEIGSIWHKSRKIFFVSDMIRLPWQRLVAAWEFGSYKNECCIL